MDSRTKFVAGGIIGLAVLGAIIVLAMMATYFYTFEAAANANGYYNTGNSTEFPENTHVDNTNGAASNSTPEATVV